MSKNKLIPIKQQNNFFPELRKFGEKGENDLFKFLVESLGYEVLDLNYKSITDKTNEIEDWKMYNKLPDFIVKDKENNVFFADAKAKKQKNLIVNKRDYGEYIKKLKWLSVKIYFLLYDYKGNKLLEIYEHNVRPNILNFIEEKMWDGNVVYDLKNFVKQIF